MSDKIKFCKSCRNNMTPKFYGYMPNSKNICPICKNEVVEVNLTDEDFWIIRHISQDVNFIEAMIDLHNNDIIEYELKMSQFRAQDQQQKDVQNVQDPQKSNIPKCPTCLSTNVRKISGAKKATSILGFGILSSNIGKTYECLNCKYKW